MTLNDAYLVSQIVAACAVVLTLIALIVTIRQNTKAQRVLAVQSITTAIAAINVPAMESPQLGSALAATTRDWASATREERVLSHYFLFTFFKLLEQAWFQHQAGALDAGTWAGWENSLLRFFHSPGVANGWWPGRRWAYSPAFRDYLAATAPVSGDPLYRLFDGAPAPSAPQEAAS
jgi:hypothetical protein